MTNNYHPGPVEGTQTVPEAPPFDLNTSPPPEHDDNTQYPISNTQPKKSVPHNLDAEESVLGALLIDPTIINEIEPILSASDFYIVRHGWIYDAIQHLHSQRVQPDLVTLCDELQARDQLAKIGGPAYLSTLVNTVPTALHAPAYAHIVMRAALRRRLITAASDIASLAWQLDRPVEELLDQAEAALFAVSNTQREHDLTPLNKLLAAYYDRIEYLHAHQGEPLGIPTGFIDLDKLLGGLQKSDVIIVAARPGVGKTSFLLNLALTAARQYQQRVAFFSLEMSNEQLVQRLVSAETGIDSQRLRTANLHDDEWPKFTEAAGRLSETLIFIDDTPGISPLQLRAKTRRMHAEYGLDLIMVDYLQLMTSDGHTENRVQAVSEISRELKQLARELHVPLVVASQLSRAVEQRYDKRPILSDLRDSGALEQDADVVLFLYRDELYNPDTELKNIADVIIAKQRHGPTGVVQLFFRKHLTQFVDAEVYHKPLAF
jgi:replicative DNA helicase